MPKKVEKTETRPDPKDPVALTEQDLGKVPGAGPGQRVLGKRRQASILINNTDLGDTYQ